MHRKSRFLHFAVVMTFALAGCESHQAKVDALQKQYDDLAAQFHKDCAGEYLKVPPAVSPKCKDEDKKVQDAWNRLQVERAKK